jgi:hypothetical protein
VVVVVVGELALRHGDELAEEVGGAEVRKLPLGLEELQGRGCDDDEVGVLRQGRAVATVLGARVGMGAEDA